MKGSWPCYYTTAIGNCWLRYLGSGCTETSEIPFAVVVFKKNDKSGSKQFSVMDYSKSDLSAGVAVKRPRAHGCLPGKMNAFNTSLDLSLCHH